MKLTAKFKGELETLQELLDQGGVEGTWHVEPNGVHLLRLRDGTSLHWSSTTGALWCDGPHKAAVRLEGRVAMAVGWQDDWDAWVPDYPVSPAESVDSA